MALNAPIFPYTPSYEPEMSVEPRLLTTTLGDGYEQSAPDGLNHMPKNWTLTFTAEDQAVTDDAESLLEERGGYQPFYWIEPTGRYAGLYKCKKWSVRTVGPGLYTLSAELQQVFDLPNELQPLLDEHGGAEDLEALFDLFNQFVEVDIPAPTFAEE